MLIFALIGAAGTHNAGNAVSKSTDDRQIRAGFTNEYGVGSSPAQRQGARNSPVAHGAIDSRY
jgi:hypothetical protein